MVRTVAPEDSVHLRLVGAPALWENRMHMKRLLLCLAVVATVCASTTPAQTWRQVGPPGGNVVSLAADPHNLDKLFLGTADGHVFTSSDEGGHWLLLSRIGSGQDDVVTHIIVDPRDGNRLYASTWALYSGGGGVYRSDDGGRTWNVIGLAHETVRALAQSPTDPKLLLAGAMTGVYRSTDEGASWERITPLKHPDLNRFDSLAFDPKDNNIIYAGTYHLPWKTTNGGKDWFPIINRRTQLMRMDPSNPNTLYAGTTSGLWKTVNEKDFRRLTPGDWIINAMLIDPRNPSKLIIGTEREGVQISNDGGETFVSANNGFHHQHISDVAMDREHPERALVVLTFDNNAFLATKDGGNSWTTLGPGLKRTEVRHVYAAPTGWWASLTNGGWSKYEEPEHKWVRAGLYVPDPTTSATTAKTTTKGKKGAAVPAPKAPAAKQQLSAYLVNDMTFGNEEWFAATAGGVLLSKDHGTTWRSASKDPLMRKPAQSVEISADGNQVWAIVERNLLYSSDKGELG